MRNIRFAAMAAALGAIAFAGSAMAYSGKSFTVINTNDEYAVEQVWFAENGVYEDPWHAVDMWSPVSPNSNSEIDISGGKGCSYDVKIRFSDSTVQTFTNVNVCRHDLIRAT